MKKGCTEKIVVACDYLLYIIIILYYWNSNNVLFTQLSFFKSEMISSTFGFDEHYGNLICVIFPNFFI